MADEFMRAAACIVAHLNVERSGRHADGQFMPVAYLLRHALELKFKRVVRLACALDLLEKDQELDRALGGHNLLALWTSVRQALEAEWPREDGAPLDNAELVIKELNRIDASGQNLRYARDKKGRATCCGYPRSIRLEHLEEAVASVFNLLDGVECELDHRRDSIAEALMAERDYYDGCP